MGVDGESGEGDAVWPASVADLERRSLLSFHSHLPHSHAPHTHSPHAHNPAAPSPGDKGYNPENPNAQRACTAGRTQSNGKSFRGLQGWCKADYVPPCLCPSPNYPYCGRTGYCFASEDSFAYWPTAGSRAAGSCDG